MFTQLSILLASVSKMEDIPQVKSLIKMFDNQCHSSPADTKNISTVPNLLKITNHDYEVTEENVIFAHNEILDIETFIRDESTYTNTLEDVTENYIKLIKTDKFDVLETFGRLDLLYSYQKNTFLPDIKNCYSKLNIASCFIKHRKLFQYHYTNYFTNQPNMIFILTGNKQLFLGMQSENTFKAREKFLLHSLSERVEYYQLFLNKILDELMNTSDTSNIPQVSRAITIIDNLTKFLLVDENVSFVISELVETERLYLNRLQSMIEVIFPKIKYNIKQRSKQKTLIGATPQIYKMQLEFYEDLKKCLFDFNPNEVGDCFVQYRDHFLLYVKDNLLKNNYDNLQECQGFLEKEEFKLFDLNTPLNRLYKYLLLLQALKKNCDKGAVQCESVNRALNQIRETISKINHNVPMNFIIDENICLEDQGDLICRELFEVQEETLIYKGMVFLFQKCVLFTETRVDEKNKKFRVNSYVYRNHIIAKYMAINIVVQSDTNFQLDYFGKFTKRSFILKARDENMKKTWINKISEILMEQLRNEKDNDDEKELITESSNRKLD